jgi:hypothetical protein
VTDLQARVQAALGAGYRVEKELGGGRMSRVFLAEEMRLDRLASMLALCGAGRLHSAYAAVATRTGNSVA